MASGLSLRLALVPNGGLTGDLLVLRHAGVAEQWCNVVVNRRRPDGPPLPIEIGNADLHADSHASLAIEARAGIRKCAAPSPGPRRVWPRSHLGDIRRLVAVDGGEVPCRALNG